MAKKAKRSVPVVNRRALSRREREARFVRGVYIAAAAILALVLGLFALGAYGQWVVEPARPVATVNGVPIRADTLERMTRYLTAQYTQFYGLQGIEPGIVVESALSSLIDDELVRQEAKRRGITVTPDEVQKRIQQTFGYNPDPPTPSPVPAETATPPASTPAAETTGTPSTPTPTPGATSTPAPTPTPVTEEGFKKLYSEYLQRLRNGTGMTEADDRNMVLTDMLRSRLQEAMGKEVPTSAEQIHARHIVLEKEEDAKAALERLSKGEKFVDLAKELSKDESNKENGGDLGWLPRGKLDSAFDEAAFALQPGQYSQVVQTSSGYEIILVEERDPNRPLDEQTLALKRSAALQEWLDKQRQDPNVVQRSEDVVQKVLRRLQSSSQGQNR